MAKDNPSFPGAQLDLQHDAVLARLSDAVYGSRDELILAKNAGRQSIELPVNWNLVGRMEDWESSSFKDDRSTGLTAAAFEMPGDADRRVVIAFRGSDEAQDWYGPNVKLAADGDLLGAAGVSGPKTEHTQKQMGDVQRAAAGHISQASGRGSKDWDPQIEAALNYALEIRNKYGADHNIEVTGHSLGGAHAQIVAHTFGWGGRTFDAPGAKNILESEGYKQWCKNHNITPAGAPDYVPGTVQTASLLNYTVNNSVVSERTGDHIGPKMSISSLAGREGFKEHAQWAVGLVGGAIAETPLLDQTVGRVMGPGAKWVEYLSKGAAVGADANERHDMSRIAKAFEEDAKNGRTIPRQFGDTARPGEDTNSRIVGDPRNPEHPNHSMHGSIHAGVEHVYNRQGLALGDGVDRTSAALLVNARLNGLDQVDHVVPGRQTGSGIDVFAVQGNIHDPAHKRAQVNTEVAAKIPVEASFQQLATVNQEQIVTLEQQSQEQTRAQTARNV